MSEFYVRWPQVSGGGGGGGVTSLNTLTGAVVLAAGSGISLTPSGNTITIANTEAGGSVTTVSVVTANGFAGTVANATTTPAITLSTSITGLLQGNGTALSAYTGGNLTTSSSNFSFAGGTGSVIGTGASLTVTEGSLTEATSSVLTISGGASAVLGSGTSIQVKQSSTSVSGYLSSTDWTTFNGKQAAGNYITSLTGDVTASGPGAAATTLASVATAGTTGSSTAIPVVTINAKGLTTGISTAAVVAPAGTLSGTTLNSTVVSSSLTSVGTISAGTWNGTGIDVAHGGTGDTSFSANQVIIGGTTSTGALQTVPGGTSTFVLTSNGATAAPTWQASSAGFTNPMTTTGDMIYSNPGATAVRLPIGTAGQTLVVASGLPSWQTQSGSSAFAKYISNQVTTVGSGVSSSTFTTTSNSPAFTFTPTISGTYKVYSPVSIQFDNGGISDDGAQVRIFNTSGGGTLLAESQGVVGTGAPSVGEASNTAFAQSIYTLTAGTPYVFDIQTKVSNGSVFVDGRDGFGSGAPFYMFAEGIALAGTTPIQFFRASSPITTNSSANSSAYPTFATFSNSPALTFTPINSGTYKIYINAPLEPSALGVEGTIQIFNTSGGGTLLENSQSIIYASTAQPAISVFTQAVYNLTAGTPYVFDIQGAVSSGSMSLIGASQTTSVYMFAEGISLMGSGNNGITEAQVWARVAYVM